MEKTVDEDRLLRGEDPSTPYLDDAVHWVSVYTELLQAKSAMLVALAERLALMREDDARHEFSETDVAILSQEAKRFQERVAFWTRRRHELEAAEIWVQGQEPGWRGPSASPAHEPG